MICPGFLGGVGQIKFPRTTSAPLEGHVRRGLGASESTNWSGYAAYGTSFTAVRGDWVQPRATADRPARGYTLAAFWVGLDGYQDNTVEQTGTEADCEGATPVYYAWWELYPKALVTFGAPVRPGDRMRAEVTQDEAVKRLPAAPSKAKHGAMTRSAW
jgi:hypothetical protein